jgi:probable F420-dependent oxidoreductase
VKFGVLPPYRSGVTADPVWMRTFARQAETSGFESLYTVEHVVVPAGYESRYPYNESGRMPLPDDVDIPDPLELLAFLAAGTTTIRLATGILVLPEHHPIQLAKRAATIDRLSGGRLTLGIGVGWLREEVEAVGVDFESRGARTDECIAALRSLWTDGEATHHGTHFAFERAGSYPKPVQQSIPIHVGGHSRAAARRAGRLGDGFHPLGIADTDLPARLDDVRRAALEAGRDPDAIELSLGGLLDQLDDDRLATAEKLSVDRLVLSTREPDLEAACQQLAQFSDRWIR